MTPSPFVLGGSSEQTNALTRRCEGRADVMARAHINYAGQFVFAVRSPYEAWPANGDELLANPGTPYAQKQSLLAFSTAYVPFTEAAALVGSGDDAETQRRLDLQESLLAAAREAARLAGIQEEAKAEAERKRLQALRANDWAGLKPERRLAYKLVMAFEDLNQPEVAERLRQAISSTDSLPSRPWW